MAVTGCKRMTIGKTVTGTPLFPESERKGAYPSSCVEIRNKYRLFVGLTLRDIESDHTGQAEETDV